MERTTTGARVIYWNMHADGCGKSLHMDENPCMHMGVGKVCTCMRIDAWWNYPCSTFSALKEDEEEGKIGVHHWKHFPISCLEQEEEEEEIQIWFKKTNLGIVVGKITLACNF